MNEEKGQFWCVCFPGFSHCRTSKALGKMPEFLIYRKIVFRPVRSLLGSKIRPMIGLTQSSSSRSVKSEVKQVRPLLVGKDEPVTQSGCDIILHVRRQDLSKPLCCTSILWDFGVSRINGVFHCVNFHGLTCFRVWNAWEPGFARYFREHAFVVFQKANWIGIEEWVDVFLRYRLA